MGTEEDGIASRVSVALEDAEEIQSIVSGFMGTLPRGGYDATPVAVAYTGGLGLWVRDSYDLVLTTRRLLAFVGDGGQSQSPAFECDRSTGHVTMLRKLGPWTWISVVFHDRELRLMVPRHFRENLRRMTEALP